MDNGRLVRESLNASQVAFHFGLTPNRSGFIKCPNHADKHGSLRLYPGQRGFYCFSCHTGGSVIDLAMLLGGIGYVDAIRELNEAFCLGLNVDGDLTEKEKQDLDERRKARERERILYSLRESAARRQYDWAFSRYERNKSIIDLGFVPGDTESEERWAKAAQERDYILNELDIAEEGVRKFDRGSFGVSSC